MSNEKDFVIENGVLNRYIGESDEVVIPDCVTRIGDYAFSHFGRITSIVIPESVTSIGNGAFNDCSSLESIVIPKSVTIIEGGTFYNCRSLKSVVIPDGVTNIESYAFCGCRDLASIVIPDSVAEIGASAFSRCESLADENGFVVVKNVLYKYVGNGKNVVIPEGVTGIEYGAFSYCNKLSSVTMPNSITTIADDVFYECNNLESILFSDNCENELAVENLTKTKPPESLKTFRFPRLSVSKVKNSAYKKLVVMGFIDAVAEGFVPSQELSDDYNKYLNSQKKKLYPDLVTNIKRLKYMLDNHIIPILDIDTCIQIAEEDGKTEIIAMLLEYKDSFSVKEKIKAEEKMFAFPSATEISKKNFTTEKHDDGTLCIENYKGTDKEVVIPGIIGKSTVSEIGEYAFSPDKERRLSAQVKSCKAITDVAIGEGISVIAKAAFLNCKKIKTVTIPSSIKSIKEYAFAGCGSIKKITIPSELTEMDECVFEGCSNLASICVDSKNSNFYSIDGVLYENNGQNKILKRCSASIEKITVPDGIRRIASSAFDSCKNIKSVVVSDTVTSIGMRAFSGCKALAEIIVPDSVTEIGCEAFLDCVELRRVKLPGNLSWVPAGIFRRSGIETVELPYGMKCIPNNAYRSCQNLRQAVLPDGIKTIDADAFNNCKNLTSVEIGEELTSIGWSAFYDCCNLTSIVIPKSITSIGVFAFCRCSSLTSITLPEGVTSIGEGAFSGCENLTIHAPAGSYAEKYAKENNIPFVAE